MSDKCLKCGMPFHTAGCGCNPTVFGPQEWQWPKKCDLCEAKDAALAALRAEVADYKTLCQGHVLAEKQWKAEVERLQEVVRWERGAKEEAYELIEEQGKLRARCEAAEGKVEKAREAMKSSSSTYSVFDKLRQILK